MSGCEARITSSPELIEDQEIALTLLMDGVRSNISQQLNRASHDSPYFTLAGKMDEVLNIDNGEVELNPDLSEQELGALGLAIEFAYEGLDCSGCSYETVCEVGSLASGAALAISRHRLEAPIRSMIDKAPSWLVGAWDHRKQKSKDSMTLAEYVALPAGLQFVGSTKARAADVSLLHNNIDGVRSDSEVSAVEFRSPNHAMKIYDARAAVSANNSQNANQNDVNEMLWQLIERAPSQIGNQPALLIGKDKSNYQAIRSYSGEGLLTEFRSSESGGKSRLYGIANFSRDINTVEYLIVGASSGNGNSDQDRFLQAIGYR